MHSSNASTPDKSLKGIARSDSPQQSQEEQTIIPKEPWMGRHSQPSQRTASKHDHQRQHVLASSMQHQRLPNTTKRMWNKSCSDQEQWKPQQQIISEWQWTAQETILQEEVHKATKDLLEK